MDATSVSDIVSYTAISSAMEMAAEVLGHQAAETLERVIHTEITGHASTTANSVHNYASSGDAGKTEYWGNTSAARRSVSSTGYLQVSDVRWMRSELGRLNVQTFDDGYYVCVVDSRVGLDLMADSNWASYHQYTQAGVGNIYNGELGQLFKFRLIECNTMPTSVGSACNADATSVLAYPSYFFGKGWLGIADWQDVQTIITQNADKADPLNEMTTMGWKALMTAKLLNTSCGIVFWSGSGDFTLDQSGVSGECRNVVPATYTGA